MQDTTPSLKKIKRDHDSDSRKKAFLNGTLLFAASFIVAAAAAFLSSVMQPHVALVITAACLIPILFIFMYVLAAHKSSVWISVGLYAAAGFALGAIPHLNEDSSLATSWIPLVSLAIGCSFLSSYGFTRWFSHNLEGSLPYAAFWSALATTVLIVIGSTLTNSPNQWAFAGLIASAFILLTCSLGFSVREHKKGYVSAFCQAHFIWIEPLAYVGLIFS